MLSAIEIAAYQPSPTLLMGRVILITGAGDGIGKAAALSASAHGATVILAGRTVAKLEKVYDQIVAAGAPEPVIAWANAAACPRVSLGHPAGLDHATGARGPVCVDATACCEFVAPTLRCVPPLGCQLFVADCGVPWGMLAKAQPVDGAAGRSFSSPFFTRPFAALR